jgi:hypothetical protein
MGKGTDFLATMTDRERAEALAALCDDLFGEQNGKRIFRQMAAGMAFQGRQLGDAPDPQDNYWKGHWRIYELD